MREALHELRAALRGVVPRVSPEAAVRAHRWLLGGIDWSDAPDPIDLETYGTYDVVTIRPEGRIRSMRRDRGAGAELARRWRLLLPPVSRACALTRSE